MKLQRRRADPTGQPEKKTARVLVGRIAARVGNRIAGSVTRLKLLLGAAIMLLLVSSALLGLREASRTLFNASAGADVRTVFHRTIRSPIEIRRHIEWLPDENGRGRTMEPTTRDEITDAYAQAWSSVDRAQQGDPEAPVSEYLSGGALTHVRWLMATHEVQSTSVKTTHITQKLVLTFYSDDGSVVAIRAPKVIVERLVARTDPRTIPVVTVDTDSSSATQHRETPSDTTTPAGVKNGQLDDSVTVDRSVESYRMVMMLRDGNWRLELIERTGFSGFRDTSSDGGQNNSAPTTSAGSTSDTEIPKTLEGNRQSQRSAGGTPSSISSAKREWPR